METQTLNFMMTSLGFKRLRITSFTDSYGAISGTSPQTGYLSKYDGTSIGWLLLVIILMH